MGEKIVLLDGHSIINRAFYGVPELTNSQGLHTNGVYGFLNIMLKILDEEKPDYVMAAFDVKAPTFRHEMYAEYKGTRKGMPEELHEQVPVLKEVLTAMGIVTVEKAGYEADDVLGTIARSCEAQGMEVALVSGDRDLLQLASEHICIRVPRTRKGVTTVDDYYAEDVLREWQVTPKEFIDLKALMGDSSDNIPGVPGIGEKTAIKLISQYHSIEEAYAHVEEIKPAKAKNSLRDNYQMAELSKVLATIKTDCELDYQLEDARVKDMFNPAVYEYFKKLEFKSLLTRFNKAEMETEDQAEYIRVSDQEQYQELLETVENCERAGMFLATEERRILGLSVAASEEKVYFLQEETWVSQVLEKLAGHKLVTLHLKQQLFHLPETFERIEIDDAGIAAYLLNLLKDTYEYDDLARDYLQQTVVSRQDLFKKLPLNKAAAEQPEDFLQYICLNAWTAYCAMPLLKQKLEDTGMLALYQEIELPLAVTLYHMEQEGIAVDKEALAEYGQKLKEQIDVLEAQIYDLSGEKFNINSPKQLGVILFEKMGLPCSKKTKTGYSTAADVLEKLRTEHPIIDKILEYRQLSKLKSTYADGLAVYIGDDGRIHGKFHQTITATGRISSTEPNLQNIPIRMEIGREIRKVFVPQQDWLFVDADYSQIELRVLAHLSGDERLIDAYRQAEDIHAITASQVFHVPLEEVTPLMRRNAKAVNFGIIYGISAFGLSEGLDISRKEASDYMEQYFKTYPEIQVYLENLVKTAKDTGLSTTLFHRIRPIPELKSGNFMQRQFGERIAMNAPIQGTAADIIKVAMVRVDQRLRQEGLRARMILQIHDELLVETPPEEVEQVKQILDKEMRQAAELAVALEIDMHTGRSWFETK